MGPFAAELSEVRHGRGTGCHPARCEAGGGRPGTYVPYAPRMVTVRQRSYCRLLSPSYRHPTHRLDSTARRRAMTPLSRTLLAVTTGAALITGPGIGAGLPATTAQAATRASCTSSVPYLAGQGGYDTYRIPATVTTGKGTL